MAHTVEGLDKSAEENVVKEAESPGHWKLCINPSTFFFLFFWHMDHIQEPVFVHFTNPKCVFLTSCSFHAITPDLYEGAN